MSHVQDVDAALERDGYPKRTRSRIERRLIETAGDMGETHQPDSIDYLHAVLCQVGLPRSRSRGASFERTSGQTSLLVEAGSLWNGRRWEQQQLPYGAKPRLALIYICSEAVRTRSPAVDIGDSVREFLLRLGLDTGGHEYGRFHQQMKALAACRMTIGFGLSTIDAKPIKEFHAWVAVDNGQRVLWPGRIELTTDFFQSLCKHAVPLDPRALGALKHSALALDVYVWLAHRLCRITKPAGIKLSWANLRDQFGQEYRAAKDFKKAFRIALHTARAAYPAAGVNEDEIGGIRLLPSPPPIHRKVIAVQKSGGD
jgi:hypothetical protein